MELEDNRLKWEKICAAFDTAGLSVIVSNDGSSMCYYSFDTDKTGRLRINGKLLPYKLSDVAEAIADEVVKDNRGNRVRIIFDDGKELVCFQLGIEFNTLERTYHNTDTVLARLNYVYRKDVLLQDVNPMIMEKKVLIAFCENYQRVVIPEGIWQIGPYAFEDSDITRVVIPRSLRKICDYAFWNCRKLESMLISGEEGYIGDDIGESEDQKTIILPENLMVNIHKAFSLTKAKIEQ